MSIKIGILGYGNLGRGVECAVKQNDDMELVAVFTRRNPEDVKILTETATVCNVADVEDWKDKIDVMIICGGSATDLPKQTPVYAKMFNVIDSFDTHARIPEHFANVDAAAKEGGHVGIISVGWDPGMFSLNRLYANAILPDGNDYTFWGKGVSQGHSDAIRRVEGVKDGKQYTIPVEAALKAVRNGENPELTTRQKHTRECFVVLEEGADAFDKALLLNALGKLEAAEHNDEYKDVITGELDKLIQDNTINMGENDLVNYMYGNACYSVGKNDIAVNIAKQTERQPRTESGYFTGAEGGRCLCTAFKALSFYMNYETKDGGKEHYNDIIAQYNAIYAEC